MPRRKARQKEQSTRVVSARVDYVLSCIRDQPWLDGDRRTLQRHVMERFNVRLTQAKEAVTLAYGELDAARAENVNDLVGFLDRVHRETIKLGQKSKDGRVITPAAAVLRKLHGVGEPDRVQHSGKIEGGNGGVSVGDRLMLDALKLTNAQRLAEIDALRDKLQRTDEVGGEAPAAHPGDDLTVPEEESSDDQGNEQPEPEPDPEFVE